MKMEPIVSSETSAIRTQTPGNYSKRNKLHLEHGESLKTRTILITYLPSSLQAPVLGNTSTETVVREASIPFTLSAQLRAPDEVELVKDELELFLLSKEAPIPEGLSTLLGTEVAVTPLCCPP